MNQNVKFLRAVLVLLLVMNVFFGYKVIKAKYFRFDPDYTYDRKTLFEKLNVEKDSSSIIFLGNSLTQQFELGELFKNVNIRNRGINGDNSSGILNRLDAIIQIRPKKIFIENGVNDIKNGVPKETLMANFKLILTRLQKETSNSKLYVQSLLPVNTNGPAVKGTGFKNETIRDVNSELEAFCRSHQITFIDLYDHFLLNGEMNPKYCIADGLHISADGYLLWTSLLKKYVDE